MFEIRAAKADDAPEACELIRRSIKELCREDHASDPYALEGWLSNKTEKNVRVWFTQLGLYSWVADEGGKIHGAATLAGNGELMLLYVLPEARFSGVSKALLENVEEQARKLRLEHCSLTSTLTARRFYLDRGYELLIPEDEEDDGLGLDAPVSMTKKL